MELTDEEFLNSLISDSIEFTPTFSEEMAAKAREELLKAEQQRNEYYRKKKSEAKNASDNGL